MYYLKIILLLPFIFSINSCEVTEEKKAKLLSDFINYYNFRPNVGHKASDGFLRSVDEIDPITYQIEVSFTAKSQKGDGSKMMKCSAGVQDLDDKGIAILNNNINCQELHPPAEDPNHAFFTADVQTGRTPITLENEVQSDTSVTSGEQFIAIPRGQPSAPCVGCASVVNPQAQGVQDLASLGVRHLDIHEPNVKHSLDSVMEVERQVQVINGVRYILTLSILFDYCAELKTDSCMTTKTCKVAILVKPWKTLPSGAKYRAILSNNCTEQWLFGDDGEVLPDPTASQDRNKKDEHTSGDDEIQVKRHEDVQSQPNAEKTLTPDEIKALEEQILPLDPVHDSSNHKANTPSSENIEADKDRVIKVNTSQQYGKNSLPPNESSKHEHGSSMLSEDKKKAIDEMLDFLKFSGYRPQNRPQPVDSVSRQKRSYDYDLQLLSLTEDYRDLKRSIENAKYIYEMAQATVDYLNEMDIEVKNRAVKNVIKAEEEEENEKHFVYLQVQVVIPCDTASCDRKQIQTKICNAVVDSTYKKSPQVLYTFCYADNKEVEILDKAKEIAFDDPVLLRLSKEVLKKMEFDSTDTHAMKIQKIVSANTRVASGRLTKITMVVDYIDCGKSVSLVLRKKCSALQHLGSRICEVLVHERKWLKEKKITYTCTERPIDMIITKNKQHKNITVDDPKIVEILQDALQYLETQSSKKNKQQIINVSKISTQVLAGFLIKIEFTVGYTNCSNNGSTSHSSKCLLLQNEHLRNCKAQVWDRSWIVDGRQMEVVCDEIDNHRSKRGIPGGVKEQNPDDPIYRQLAEESLQKYVSNSGDKKPHTLLRIEKVTTQIVAGSLTEIEFVAVSNDNPQGDVKKCQSRIWERPWLNEKEVTVTCDIDNHRSKRGIPGGVMEQNPDDPTYRQLAEESLQKYVSNRGDKKPHTLLRIEKVTTQVVEGSLTVMDFMAVPMDNLQDVIKKCHSTIWERPWLKEKKITVTCEIDDHISNRELVGGGLELNDNNTRKNITIDNLVEQDPSKPQYLQLANESLQKFLVDSCNKEPHKVAKVEKVTTQIVSGKLTRLEFIALPMNTSKSDIFSCYAEVWERPWTEEKDIKVSCDLFISIEMPKNNSYIQWANESLQKYLSDTRNHHPYKIVQIEQASVRFFLTKIIFVASSTEKSNDSLNCMSEIFHALSLIEKKIHVICESDSSIDREKWDFMDRSKINKHVYDINKKIIEEGDVKKVEFSLLALQSLRKFSKRIGTLHKLVAVSQVTKVRTSQDIVYKIKYNANPTECPFNVSNMRALTCQIISNTTLYCKAKIWERPELPERKIHVICVMPEDYLDLLESEEEEKSPDTNNELTETEISRKVQESKAYVLAKEALEQYLSIIHAKNVHRIIAIHSHYEYLADEIVEFAISPTKCLINHFKDSRDNCSFVQPRVIHNCKAKSKGRALFKSDNDMKVTCRKLHMSKEKTNKRLKRQIKNEQLGDAENEIDEDTMYYYAKSAVSQINTNPQNSNMFKLVTIHAVKSSIQMKAIVVKMYLEVAETYCLRHQTDVNLENCEEMEGLNHRLCLARIYPAPSDELVIRHVHVVCDDDEREFNALTGLHIFELLRLSIDELERKPETHFKLVHQGEPQLIPTLEAKNPMRLNFIIAFTNCSKTVDLDKNPYQCYLDNSLPSKSCSSFIWLETATRTIKFIKVDCNSENARQKRSSLNTANATTDSTDIKDLVEAALAKLELSSLHRYKQRVLHINSYSSKITTGKVTTIDFDVAYTSCIKYEWVKNVTDCEIIDHLPRRHCVAQIWERLWIHNGQHINVTCEDDETPLEAHIEFESAEMASQLAQQALKHIEAKYPHPQKQKIVRIFSLEKQLIAGIHYKMKVEVGFTHCLALSVQNNCTLNNDGNINRFCRVNVWLRPWIDHPPNFRVSCDFQESVASDLYHSVQAEHLFYDFVTTYNPSYVNDHAEFEHRFEIFKANIKKIHELNVHEKGTATYGVTRFADLTYKEFSSRYAGLNPKLRNNSQIPMKDADVPKMNLPANFDWREFDAVTAVKDQGSCGSSWAFSVTGNIEGQWRMQSGELVSLSEQQLLDCDSVNKGCSGGLPENAYRTIEKQGGLETQLNYPYEGEVDNCLFNQTLAKAKISGSVNITSNETGMALWLVQNGPISIGINANAMQFYVNGISHPWDSYCDPGKLDHAALIVGYGVKEYHAFNKKITYWLVKNSWGTSWGEQGYYRVHRGTGTCGINRMATSAFIPSM